MTLTGVQRQEIKQALIGALIGGMADLDQVVDVAFNVRVDTIVPINANFDEVVYKVVVWADARTDHVLWLLTAAGGFNPDNDTLRMVTNNIIEAVNHWANPGAAPPAQDQDWFVPDDPYQAMLLANRQIYLDRHTLRKTLARLGGARGARILGILGPTGSGKSHCRHYLAYLAPHKQAHVVYLDLKNLPSGKLDLGSLAQEIAYQMGVPVSEIPVQNGTDAAWARAISFWLTGAAAKQMKMTWLLIDGTDRARLPIEVKSFVQGLMQQLMLQDCNLHLVLLGCNQTLPPVDVRSAIKMVELDCRIKEQDVELYFRSLFCSHRQCEAVNVQQDVEAVLTDVRTALAAHRKIDNEGPYFESLADLSRVVGQITETLFFN